MGTKTAIDFASIPDKAFLPAVQVRDIVKIRPLTSEEKSQIKRGTADILADPVIGKNYLISRNDLLHRFTYTNGSKIKIGGMQSTKQYIVVGNANTSILMMQVPANHTVEVNGEIANRVTFKNSDYILCLPGADGNLDRSTASVVTSAVFKKMCYVPANEVIMRHKGSKNRFFDIVTSMVGAPVAVAAAAVKAVEPMRQPRANAPVPSVTLPTQPSTPSALPGALPTENRARYKIAAQILDEYGKRVGFVIQSESGATKEVVKDVAINLCKSGKISNADVVTGPDGAPFLRGNNVKLSELPIINR